MYSEISNGMQSLAMLHWLLLATQQWLYSAHYWHFSFYVKPYALQIVINITVVIISGLHTCRGVKVYKKTNAYSCKHNLSE